MAPPLGLDGGEHPVADVVLLAAAAYMLLSGRRGRGAFYLLVASLLALALADLGYGVDLGQADPYSVPSSSARAAVEAEHEHLHTEPLAPFLNGLPDPVPTAG